MPSWASLYKLFTPKFGQFLVFRQGYKITTKEHSVPSNFKMQEVWNHQDSPKSSSQIMQEWLEGPWSGGWLRTKLSL